MIEVEFLKDFATRKQGETMKMDSAIASGLIRRKVAKAVGAKPKPKTAAKKPKTSNKTTK